jgi:hypothetical protein
LKADANHVVSKRIVREHPHSLIGLEELKDIRERTSGLLFVCQNCHYTLHADLIGARNVTMRTLLMRQDWVRTGQLSVAPGSLDGPDVSASEAKAARLARYAELRWRLDTSPSPSGDVVI